MAAEPSSRATSPTGRSPWWRRIAIAAGVLIALALLAMVGRRFVVTALVERGLRERGVTCGRLDVDVPWNLSEIAIGETTCRFGEGAREVEAGLPSGATIHLDGLRAERVEAEEITLATQGAAREVEDLGAALIEGTVPEPLARGLDGLARLSQQSGLPHVAVHALRLRRGEQTIDGYDFALDPGEDGLHFSLGSIAPPAIGERRIEVSVALVALEGNASASAAELRGRVEIHVEVGTAGLTRGVAFRVSGAALDGDAARYEVWIEDGERIRQLRERALAARAQREERVEERLVHVDHIRERVHELAERLRGGDEVESADAGAP